MSQSDVDCWLQWGRAFDGAESSSFSTSGSRWTLLQWGRAFDGAERSGHRCRGPGGIMLQWGRAFDGAERRGGRTGSMGAPCFNGAAPLTARRDGLGAVVVGIPPLASMGPRL